MLQKKQWEIWYQCWQWFFFLTIINNDEIHFKQKFLLSGSLIFFLLVIFRIFWTFFSFSLFVRKWKRNLLKPGAYHCIMIIINDVCVCVRPLNLFLFRCFRKKKKERKKNILLMFTFWMVVEEKENIYFQMFILVLPT